MFPQQPERERTQEHMPIHQGGRGAGGPGGWGARGQELGGRGLGARGPGAGGQGSGGPARFVHPKKRHMIMS